MDLPFAENYKIKMVEPIYQSTREQREKWIDEAHYNLFNLRSDQVFIDLLTDSGTGAMSDRQWGALMTGDESYAGSSSFHHLKDKVKEIFGFDYFLPVHQGRAAENVLFSVLVKEGQVVPGNSHFDTTKGHIEFRKANAIDCTIDEAFDTNGGHPFKGNIDIEKLTNVLESHTKEQIPLIIVTLTCNSSGGQPVSMENIKQIRAAADQYGIPVIFDSARFAENAWFIQNREEGYANKSIREIVAEMYQYADGMTMSSKKDGIVNIGGILAMRSENWYKQAMVFNIMYEGFNTYGGMAGRDMNALAVKGNAAEFALDMAGAATLHEKTVIDTCNPISEEPLENGVLKFFTKPNSSLMEKLQNKYSRVHFVKAFNSVGNALMVDPQFEEGRPTMFICGNNDKAKGDVQEVLDLFGWDVADLGKVEAARAIEPLCMLWCIPGFLNNEWNHAFKLLKK